MSVQSTKRQTNFSHTEKMRLIDLVEDKRGIIENKKTDSVSTKEKEQCWIAIANKFNSTNICGHRDMTNLKNCWENLKKKTKKHFADIRSQMYATGMYFI